MDTEVRKRVMALLNDMDRDDLKETWDMVKEVHDFRTRQTTRLYSVGDMVQWDSKRGMTAKGKVTKVNEKTLSIRGEDGTPWKVTSTLVQMAA